MGLPVARFRVTSNQPFPEDAPFQLNRAFQRSKAMPPNPPLVNISTHIASANDPLGITRNLCLKLPYYS